MRAGVGVAVGGIHSEGRGWGCRVGGGIHSEGRGWGCRGG